MKHVYQEFIKEYMEIHLFLHKCNLIFRDFSTPAELAK